jgi:hypothetical protein
VSNKKRNVKGKSEIFYLDMDLTDKLIRMESAASDTGRLPGSDRQVEEQIATENPFLILKIKKKKMLQCCRFAMRMLINAKN